MQRLAASRHGLVAISPHPSPRNMHFTPVDEARGARGRPNLGSAGTERHRWVPGLTLLEETTLTLAPRPHRMSYTNYTRKISSHSISSEIIIINHHASSGIITIIMQRITRNHLTCTCAAHRTHHERHNAPWSFHRRTARLQPWRWHDRCPPSSHVCATKLELTDTQT